MAKKIHRFLPQIISTILLFVILISLGFLIGCTANQQRGLKTIESNWSGGLDRVVILYDYSGNEIQRWEGKIDLQVSEEGGHVIFDQDGKRTVIAGGILVSEEK